MNYRANIYEWTKVSLANLDKKTRKLMTMNRSWGGAYPTNKEALIIRITWLYSTTKEGAEG